ncbi:hypothetical protein SAMN05216483_6233 [Streptomyces sp. 2131.1]|uniref:hypothetical protein n=1 Tax=Streptomyces sp. 2131.1 TaxID=1855346 RepID=UPI00089420BD|nr:hypothetical protein [Streptomyces sp. 2131.1]SEE44323.1 hypothetical protein SAMN05216483_6233 [Streptomyces sp. 2131.1]
MSTGRGSDGSGTRAALGYAKKAGDGDADAAQPARSLASLAAAARMERLDWRMRVLGDQLDDVKKAVDRLRLKLPER